MIQSYRMLHWLKVVWKGNGMFVPTHISVELQGLKLIEPCSEQVWKITDIGQQIVGKVPERA